MNTIKKILLKGGYITAEEHKELEGDFPNLPIVIKWGVGPRESATLKELRDKIIQSPKRGDYVREVFLPVATLDQLRNAFGITEEDVRKYWQG